VYPLEKRPPVPLGPFDSLNKACLKETIKGLTSIIRSEWVQEGELSSEVIQIQTPSLTIACYTQGIADSALYNPMVGANNISAFFALNHLSENPMLPTTRSLRTRPYSIIEGTELIHDMLVWHEKVKIALYFHVFKVHDFRRETVPKCLRTRNP
jgi:hypothetical protein